MLLRKTGEEYEIVSIDFTVNTVQKDVKNKVDKAGSNIKKLLLSLYQTSDNDPCKPGE